MKVSKENTMTCGGSCKDTCCHYSKFCSGCNDNCRAAFCHYGHCSSCDYLCSRRSGAETLFNTLGGPEFPYLRISPTTWPGEVPPILPAVATRFGDMPAPGSLPWVVINAARMVISRNFKAGGLRRKSGNIREFARVHPDTRIAMHMYIPDPPLEAFWRTRRDIYPSLREFDLVIAPNFSVYEDSPRLEHLINIKRSTLVYVEMLQNGIRAVPDVSWATYDDLDRWADYINRYSIPVISTSIQTVHQNASNYWRKYLNGVQYLARKIPRETVIILAGAGSIGKIKTIRIEIRQQLVFLTTQPFLLARKGRLINRQLAVGPRNYDRLFLENLEAFRKEIL
ncbi:MAG TPA: hypothetical protein DEF36_09995 [Desulfotomaculum sp.]|nr:hypothetical protein [Desulfotomaculum sp.]